MLRDQDNINLFCVAEEIQDYLFEPYMQEDIRQSLFELGNAVHVALPQASHGN